MTGGEARVNEYVARHPSYDTGHDGPAEPEHLMSGALPRAEEAHALGKGFRLPRRAKRSKGNGEPPELVKAAKKRDRSVASFESAAPATLPNEPLVRLVLWSTTLHLIAFAIVFIVVYGALDVAELVG